MARPFAGSRAQSRVTELAVTLGRTRAGFYFVPEKVAADAKRIASLVRHAQALTLSQEGADVTDIVKLLGQYDASLTLGADPAQWFAAVQFHEPLALSGPPGLVVLT